MPFLAITPPFVSCQCLGFSCQHSGFSCHLHEVVSFSLFKSTNCHVQISRNLLEIRRMLFPRLSASLGPVQKLLLFLQPLLDLPDFIPHCIQKLFPPLGNFLFRSCPSFFKTDLHGRIRRLIDLTHRAEIVSGNLSPECNLLR